MRLYLSTGDKVIRFEARQTRWSKSWEPNRLNLKHLCRGVRYPQRVSWMWHLIIWWWRSSPRALRNVEYLFIAITPRSTLTRSCSAKKGPIYGLNRTVWHLNCVQAKNNLQNTCNCISTFGGYLIPKSSF